MQNIKEEYDYVIIGSGFGGSVSAMRLAQKGYKVAVIEAGKRFKTNDFPKTNWSVRKFLWMPKLFMYGIQRIQLLKNVLVLSGAGVGGGSLVYANTLYVPNDEFFKNNVVKKMGSKKSLLGFYETAKKMLGVTENDRLTNSDHLMKEVAASFDKESTFTPTPVGVFLGDESKFKNEDPYFFGEGPSRTSCNDCGGCMVGCRYGAKNTLDKNYLYFAEKLGVDVYPDSKVVDVVPQDDDGANGYEVITRRSTSIFGYPKRKFKTRGVVFSAGALGTMNLMLSLKESERLPNLSNKLGNTVRTNSEAILGVTSKNSQVDYSRGMAITSSVHPDVNTHIEPVRYSKGSDLMGTLATILVDGGKFPRQLKFIIEVLKHPINFIRSLNPIGFAKKSIILLVMQNLDNSIQVMRKRNWFNPFKKTLTSKNEGKKIPTYIPVANEFAKRLAKKIDGIPGSAINEVLLDVPTTAHILGGAVMGESAKTGVIDLKNKVFGYRNMLVCDGSMIPANLGVNPSLSITALTERAMSLIPAKSGKKGDIHTFNFEKKWNSKRK